MCSHDDFWLSRQLVRIGDPCELLNLPMCGFGIQPFAITMDTNLNWAMYVDFNKPSNFVPGFLARFPIRRNDCRNSDSAYSGQQLAT